MGQWLEKLKKKTQDLPPDELKELKEAPFCSSFSRPQGGYQENQVTPQTSAPGCDILQEAPKQTCDKGAPIHIRSDILDTDLWIVPDNFFDTPVYTDSEIQELAHLNLSPGSLKAVHMVKTTFDGVIVDAETYPVPPEIFSYTPHKAPQEPQEAPFSGFRGRSQGGMRKNQGSHVAAILGLNGKEQKKEIDADVAACGAAGNQRQRACGGIDDVYREKGLLAMVEAIERLRFLGFGFGFDGRKLKLTQRPWLDRAKFLKEAKPYLDFLYENWQEAEAVYRLDWEEFGDQAHRQEILPGKSTTQIPRRIR